MKRIATALLGALLASGACQAGGPERTVWDALHLGRADDATRALVAHAVTSQRDSALYFLAVAAQAVIAPAPAHSERLRAAFRAALNPYQGIALPRPQPDFPVGFDRERLLTALAGALVAIGDIEFALDALEQRLDHAEHPDAELLWQVLRVVGGARAKRILNGPQRFNAGEWFPKRLAEARYFPDWEDLQRFSNLLPAAQRTLAELERAALAGCGVQPAVAAYYLAHVAAPDASAQARIDDTLLRVARRTENDCFWARLLAARSLALRGTRAPEFWAALAQVDTQNAYFGAAIARFAFAQHGRDFAPHALRWLEQPTDWYVEAELGANLAALMETERLRDYWDIWQVRGSGYFSSVYRYKSADIALDVAPVLAWLERRGPAASARLQHWLLGSSGQRATGAAFQTWLQLAVRRPAPETSWWIFQHVNAAAALPVLRYWKQTAEPQQRASIERYERSIANFIDHNAPPCCGATEICLRERVLADNARRVAAQTIGSQQELSDWITRAPWLEALSPDPQAVRLLDPATRLAEVRVAGRPSTQWQHLFGCWLPLRRD